MLVFRIILLLQLVSKMIIILVFTRHFYRESVTETTATCRTGGGTAGDKHVVVMSFDGTMRESTDMFTYQSNPEVIDVQPRSSIQRYVHSNII